ncbi:MAG: hypothetical protein H6993_10070 [Pseudomonadales bacterium]|nr:hypothetical protein [Pseudomonadales bacterium]MCP5184299.1 hypothetical protein [Pseudomonadales bacterium]
MKDLLPTKQASILRGIGLVLLLTCIFLIDGHSNSPLHRLWLPLVMAVGAALALHNVLAVALAILALTGIHADFGSPDWVVSVAYPCLAALAGLVVGVIVVQRFREHVRETRVVRARQREERRMS